MRDGEQKTRVRTADLVGRTFGHFIVESVAPERKSTVRARCECGRVRLVVGWALLSGKRKSCGCRKGELIAKNRTYPTKYELPVRANPEHNSWSAMIERCHRPGASHYQYYGGRGIAVCLEWRASYAAFRSHIGPRPPGTTLDRIDNSRGYEPGNVRWATHREQALNRRSTRFVEFRGETRCVTDWARTFGLTRSALSCRLRRGMSMDEAVAFRGGRHG